MKTFLHIRFLLAFAVALAALYALYASLHWPLRAALFPRVIGIPLLLLALAEMLLSVLREEKEREGHAVDFELTTDVDPVVARKRTLAILAWTVGFLVLIVLIGFPIAVPLFVFLYLRTAGKEGWVLTILITALSWLFMEGLFTPAAALVSDRGVDRRERGRSCGPAVSPIRRFPDSPVHRFRALSEGDHSIGRPSILLRVVSSSNRARRLRPDRLCEKFRLVNNRASLDLLLAGFVFPAGDPFVLIVVFQFVHLALGLDLIARAAGESASRGAAPERTAACGRTKNREQQQ
ncbi:MAG: tripartite tricarboxylate transporter TctB family protein [Deltaproteobacteria bacterium]|nr:tripartite tricarboxylate transporter TctB family protein [Deltaproteobacteria bacterium]